MANDLLIRNGFISQSDSNVQGSLTATTYFSGSTSLSNIFATTGTTNNLQTQINALNVLTDDTDYLLVNSFRASYNY